MNDAPIADAADATTAEPPPSPAPAAAAWPLHVLSTPGRRSAGLAQAVWQLLSQAGRVSAGGLARSVPASVSPDARCLLLVDGPAAAVAGALQAADGEPLDVASVLQAWNDGARPLLRLAMQQPSRCLCIDAAEALERPAALWAALAAWEPALTLAPAPALPRRDDDALAWLLAGAATRDAGAAARLFDELRATTVVLGDDPTPAEGDPGAAALGAYVRLQRQLSLTAGQLRQAQTERDAQRQDAAALQAQLLQTQQRLEQQVQQRHAAEQESVKLQSAMAGERQRLQSALAEREAQLRQAADAAQALQEGRRATEAALDAARQESGTLRHECDALRQAAGLVQVQLHQVQAELAQQRQGRQAAEQQLQVVHDTATQAQARQAQALAGAEQERDALRQERELLRAQLQQLQEELEAVFLKGKDHEKRLADESMARADSARQQAELQQRVLALQAERDAQARLAQERATALQLADANRRKGDADLAGLQAALDAAREALAGTSRARQQLAAQSETLSQRLAEVLAQRDAEARLAEEREVQADALQRLLSDADAERSRLGEAVAALETRLAEVQAAAQAASAQRGELAQAVLALRAERAELQNALQAQRDECGRLDAELAALQSESAAQRASLQQEWQSALESLRQAQGERDALAGELDAQRARADGLDAAVIDGQRQRSLLEARLVEIEDRFAVIQADAQQHQDRLVADLAATATALQDLQQQREALAADLLQQQTRGDDLQRREEQQAARIAELDAQARRQREQLTQAAQQQTQTASQLIQVGQQLRRAQLEHGLLAGQLQRLHETLQRQHGRQRREGRAAPVTVAQVEFGAPRMEPPFRDLACALREVRIDEHEVPALELRLVEHHGHPGLVLFDGPTPGAGFGAFARSGDEDGRAYMLLVPEDLPARTTLSHLGSHDWRLLLGILAALDEALVRPEAEPLLFWRGVLRRLRAQIDDQPARLRYDALDLAAETDQALRLDYRQALFGERLHDSLALRWTPGARGSTGGPPPTLLLTERDEAGPPLASWPLDTQGRPLPEWPLPLDPAMPPAERQQRWRALPRRDRELLLALLDALPAAVDRLAQAHLVPAGHDRDSLAAAAAHWLPEARRVVDPVFLLRRAARKLRGIMRSAA